MRSTQSEREQSRKYETGLVSYEVQGKAAYSSGVVFRNGPRASEGEDLIPILAGTVLRRSSVPQADLTVVSLWPEEVGMGAHQYSRIAGCFALFCVLLGPDAELVSVAALVLDGDDIRIDFEDAFGRYAGTGCPTIEAEPRGISLFQTFRFSTHILTKNLLSDFDGEKAHGPGVPDTSSIPSCVRAPRSRHKFCDYEAWKTHLGDECKREESQSSVFPGTALRGGAGGSANQFLSLGVRTGTLTSVKQVEVEPGDGEDGRQLPSKAMMKP